MTLAQKIEELTENNLHTQALIVKAKAINNALGDAFAVILQEIEDESELVGQMSQENSELRYSIDLKLRKYDEYLGLV